MNFHGYTNLLNKHVKGLIQELLETCKYCLCVIGTIYWHEVIACEHHVSVDQKCSFITTASHSSDKSCTAEFSTLGFLYLCTSAVCEYSSLDLFVFTFLWRSAKVENCFFAWACYWEYSVTHNTVCIWIVKCHLKFKVHTEHTLWLVYHINLHKSLLRCFFCTLNQNPGIYST